jgi:molybdate transport system substrate-binding protein
MRIRLTAICAALTLLCAAGCAAQAPSRQQTAPPPQQQPAQPAETTLMVSAAASLTDVLNELKPAFEREHPGLTVTYNFGGSGKLATQIEQGAPADVFLSASKQEMDRLEEKQLIAKDTRLDFAKNELVLITASSSPLALTSFEELGGDAIKHLAVGEPVSVPAGRYAKEALEHLKLWDGLSGKLVFGSDVRQVLTYVESGNADAGIVYASDAALSPNVKVIAAAKPEWHKPIVYPGAVVAASRQADTAKAFLDFLTSEKGKAILQKYGFRE